MLSFFSAAITAGIPGFMSYVYLSKIGVLQYNKDEKDEKIIVLTILSFLNIGVTYYVFRLIFKLDPLTELTWTKVPILFVIGVIVTIIMTLLYERGIDFFSKKIKDSRLNKRKSIKNNKNIYENALRKSEGKNSFVYIFNFKNEFIESGYFYFLDDLEGKLRLGLSTNTCHTKEAFTIREILKIFNEEEDVDKKEIIIDVDNQLKLFLFYL